MSDVVVIPLGTPDVEQAASVASIVENALSSAGVPLISMHDARDRFTARSRAPRRADSSDLEALASAAREAIEHVAFGRTAAAQKAVREAIGRAERALESLNRETATARQILDVCLSLVRSSLQEQRRDLAREQAMRCRQLVPDLSPSRAVHPADVIGVLAEADDLLARMQIGHLAVQSAPENGCSVYLNGRHLGTTPFELERAAEGEYRVQVECGGSPGRVHVVQLDDRPVSLLVNTELDHAIATEPRLWLRYDSMLAAGSQALAHAIEVGHDVGARELVIVDIEGEDAELVRVQVGQQRVVGRASVPWTAQRRLAKPALAHAIVALTEGRIEGAPRLDLRRAEPAKRGAEQTTVTAAQPTTAEPRHPVSSIRPHESSSHGGGRRKLGLGVTALAAGAASLTVAGALTAQRQAQGEQLRSSSADVPAYFQYLQSWEERRTGPYVFAALGSAFTTMGVLGPLLSSPRRIVPWWPSMLGGVAGVSLASWATVDLLRGGSCPASIPKAERGMCSHDEELRDRGAVVMLAATPFISLPIAQMTRRIFSVQHREDRLVLGPRFSPLGKAFFVTLRLVERRRQAL